MATAPGSPPQIVEQTETFFCADEVDEPPPAPEKYESSKPHTVPKFDTSTAPALDTVAQQNIIIHDAQQDSRGLALDTLDDEDLFPEETEDESKVLRDGTRMFVDGSKIPPGGKIRINQSTASLSQSRSTGVSVRPGLQRGSGLPSTAPEVAQTTNNNGNHDLQGAEILDGVAPQSDTDAGQGRGQAGPEDQPQTTDSLSLGQLKMLLQEMPKSEPTSYAFEYADSSSFEEELEELFDYTAEERQQLIKAQEAFSKRWSTFKSQQSSQGISYEGGNIDWQNDEAAVKVAFLHELRRDLLGENNAAKAEALSCAVYLALGCWVESALGIRDEDVGQDNIDESDPYGFAETQLAAIDENVQMLSEEIGVETFYTILRCAYDTGEEDVPEAPASKGQSPSDRQYPHERWTCFVILYLLVDLARRNARMGNGNQKLRDSLINLTPSLLTFLTKTMTDSRWNDTEFVPPTKLLLLTWKTILRTFGGIAEISEIKNVLADERDAAKSSTGPWITASPIDYHMFRQEIISKYPAFDPPKALFPFDPESNSIIPLLQDHPSRSNSMSSNVGEAGPANIQTQDTSIMQQPVHIATPAPSPPPSPAGPGKGIKKQNYQTNQMFPFLYPPLDESSNDLGGKGSTELQDLLAGRKWQGRDIPASILEAAELFSQRMRATRGMRQLWEERVRFLRFEKGQEDIDEFELNGESDKAFGPSASNDLNKLTDVQRKSLKSVEDFYDEMLPHLQSLVIVLLKVLLQAVATLMTQQHGAEGLRNTETAGEQNGQQKPSPPAQTNGDVNDADDPTLTDVVTTRSQEIAGKAVSGILILLLKWFRLSHILKFEYLSQLLLDNQYIQLILKLFAHQELERVVNFKCERRELNFLTWSRTRSRHPAPIRTNTASTNTTSESAPSEPALSPDDAAPPPIARDRGADDSSLQASDTSNVLELTTSPQPQGPLPPTSGPAPPPEVDELGYPTTAPPARPITHYSWRTFFTSINHLRILQKLLKAKPHRQLLMVQSKYSLTLKKHLRVPESLIRLYTLKIIKGQVPYCHRKWRSSNMRIITAIYLHVKPGLRDEWLSGLDVEQEISEALPMEQALRAMTWWWHLRSYPRQMGVAGRKDDEEGLSDFVRSKLDAIDRRLAEEDARFVQEMLGMHVDSLTHITNGDGLHAIANGSTEDDLIYVPPEGYEAIPSSDNGSDAAFDMEYDPFAKNGHVPSSSSHLNGAAASHNISFLPSTARRTSTTSITSKPTSRRPSLKETLLGDPDPDDDFFLKELEKMDLSDRFPRSAANSRNISRTGSEADLGEMLQNEREHDGTSAGMPNGGAANDMPREQVEMPRYEVRTGSVNANVNANARLSGLEWNRQQSQIRMQSTQALAAEIDRLDGPVDQHQSQVERHTDGQHDGDRNADGDADTEMELRRRQAIADKLNGMIAPVYQSYDQDSHDDRIRETEPDGEEQGYQAQAQEAGRENEQGDRNQSRISDQSQNQSQDQSQEQLRAETYVDEAA